MSFSHGLGRSRESGRCCVFTNADPSPSCKTARKRFRLVTDRDERHGQVHRHRNWTRSPSTTLAEQATPRKRLRGDPPTRSARQAEQRGWGSDRLIGRPPHKSAAQCAREKVPPRPPPQGPAPCFKTCAPPRLPNALFSTSVHRVPSPACRMLTRTSALRLLASSHRV